MTRQEKEYKNLNEFVKSQVDQPTPAKKKSDAPTGFEAGVSWSNKTKSGTITSRALKKNQEPNWDEHLSQWGYDPQQFKIKKDTLQFRCWDANFGVDANGDPIIETLYYYRCDIELKSPETDDLDYVELVKEIKQHKKAPIKTKLDNDFAFTVCISDWQIGVRSTDKIMKRILESIDDVEDRIKELKKMGIKPNQLVIYNLGDIVENCSTSGWYANQIATLDVPNVREQMMIARRLVMKCIERWTKYFDKVLIISVPSNHGQTRSGYKAITDENADNLDLQLFDNIAEICTASEAYKHIKFVIPERDYKVTLNIKDVIVQSLHGHQLGAGTTAYAKAKSWAEKQALQIDNQFDVLLNGHLHHFSWVNESTKHFIQAPCMLPPDENDWFSAKYGSVSNAGCLTFVVGGEKKIQYLEVL